MKYLNNRDVAVGDRLLLWHDQPGTVVCSIDTGEFTEEYPKEQWGYLKSGILAKTDIEELFHYTEPDEDLELMGPHHMP
jgi:hypothetical protein